MKYLVPVGRNLGHSLFSLWLDNIHPNGSEICWAALFPEAHDKLGQERDATQLERIRDFWFENRQIIKETLGFDSQIDPETTEIYLIIDENDLVGFHWCKYTYHAQ